MIAAYILAQTFAAEVSGYLMTPRKGQSLVEYALILILVAVAVIGAVVLLGTTTSTSLQGTADNLG